MERFEFQKLFESVGVSMTYIELPYVGAEIEFNDENEAVISKYTYPGSPAYESGLEKGDVINTINKRSFTNKSNLKNTIDQAKIGKKVGIKFERFGVKKSTELRFIPNPKILLNSMLKIDDSAAELKNMWIKQ